MADGDLAAQVSTSVVPQEGKFKVKVDEAMKLSFWISQIFIIVATVLGVYLAASQGFKQALAYENLLSDKNNYYLRDSLRAELADNVELVKEYMEKLKTGGIPARKSPIKLDTFIWDSMKFSSATLETPSELLAASRRFYRQVLDIQERVAASNYSVEHANKLLQAIVEDMENNILPKFEVNIEALRRGLDGSGLKL